MKFVYRKITFYFGLSSLNSRYSSITVVKYSKTLLNTKADILKSTVDEIETEALTVSFVFIGCLV